MIEAACGTVDSLSRFLRFFTVGDTKILNHVETGVTAVYDRHSYDLEKRAALDFWGRRLDAIISNTPVTGKLLRFSAAG